MPLAPISTPVSLSTFYASGTGVPPASGSIDPTLSGPFLMEEQSLDITYVRVPKGQLSSVAFSLSSVVPTESIALTHIVAKFQANYSRTKVYAGFGTSSYQQPQKFTTLAASADAYGNSYGSTSGVSGIIMGPMGQIITSQPWILRRPWLATDTEVASAITVANCFASTSTSGTIAFNPEPLFSHFQRSFLGSENAGTLVSDYELEIDSAYSDYNLPGTYNPLQETNAQKINFIEATAVKITNEQLYDIPATWGGSFFLADVGLPEYSKFRHDYT